MNDQNQAASPLGRQVSATTRTRIAIVVASVAVALAGGFIVLGTGGGPDAAGVAATLKVPGHPRGVVVGSDALWVVLSRAPDQTESASVLRINLVTGAIEQRVELPGVPVSAIHAGDALWISNAPDGYESPGTLVQRDWATGSSRSEIRLDGPAGVMAASESGSIWLMLSGDRIADGANLVEVDRVTGQVKGRPIHVSDRRSIGLAVAVGAIWATAHDDGLLVRIDPTTHELRSTTIGRFPVGVVEAGGSLWVANRGDGTVVRVDPTSMAAIGEPIRVGMNPTFLAAAAGSVWVANQPDGTVSRIDISTAQVTETIRVAAASSVLPAADDVGTDGSDVWVTSMSDDVLARLRTSP